MSQILCYDGIYTSPPSNKKWETTALATANVCTITQTGWQHPSSTNLPTLEGSSGTIRQIFQLDPRKSIVKLLMDKTDRSWLNTHRWYITGGIPCMPLAIPNHTAAECSRTDCRFSGRFNKKNVQNLLRLLQINRTQYYIVILQIPRSLAKRVM